MFEWMGRQVRIKENEGDTRLVLTQVRNKLTGEYMSWEQRSALAKRYRVEHVRRVRELEDKSLEEAFWQVNSSGEHIEGYVVKLESGQLVKLKTVWWQRQEHYKYRRWWDEEQREHEQQRRRRKVHRMQVQELRAVVAHTTGLASTPASTQVRL